MGDSMISGIDQQRLSIKGRIVKVRLFSGATINDMYDDMYGINPLLTKATKMSSYMLVPTWHQIAYQELF